MRPAPAVRTGSWLSTAPRFRLHCWRANSSVMSEAPSRVRSLRRWADFKRLIVEHCFWMRSETFLWSCNQNCSAPFRRSSSSAWAAANTFQVDVRVIAATNQDLWRMVQERTFRADLYYRLNVFPITLPPLRQRGDDIPLLIEHFVQMFAKRQGKSIFRIPEEVMEVLKCYDWPGNIRELQNVIERAVIMTTGPVLNQRVTELITQDIRSAPIRTLVDAERAHIIAILHETNWVVGGPRGAAAQLGLARTTLIAMMARLGISTRDAAPKSGGAATTDSESAIA